MPLPLAELKTQLAPGDRLVGLDPGTKTLGVAISDPGLRVATALSTIRRKKLALDLAALRDLLAERQVGGFVIGLPRNMDGSEGPRAQSVRAFARNLEMADLWTAPPILALWDERLSTRAVERVMVEDADLSRQRRARSVDAMAATYILQGALDALSHTA